MPNLNINGRSLSVEAANDTPLLWAIREQLQMTGTKFGCGAGLCGACTVHVNGEAVRSCQTTLSDVAGKKITTIEGLSAKGCKLNNFSYSLFPCFLSLSKNKPL